MTPMYLLYVQIKRLQQHEARWTPRDPSLVYTTPYQTVRIRI